jgi:hypothetical protein
MDEYNLNNSQKINSINFINITDEKKPSSNKNPFNKLKQNEYFNLLNNNNLENSYLFRKSKHSQRNFHSFLTSNKKYINTIDNVNNTYYIKSDNVHNNSNDIPIPKSSVPLYRPQNNSGHLVNFKNNNYSQRKPRNNDEYNNIKSNYMIYLNNNSNFINNNNYNSDYLEKDDMMPINNNTLYNKQINEYKMKNKILFNKLNNCLNELKIKSKEIQDLEQKNKDLQNELTKNNTRRKINNEKKINHKIDSLNSKENIRNINNNNLNIDRKNELNEKIENSKSYRRNALSK